jgi:hypothetical protein
MAEEAELKDEAVAYWKDGAYLTVNSGNSISSNIAPILLIMTELAAAKAVIAPAAKSFEVGLKFKF